MAPIVLEHITKRFPDGSLAVNDFNLDIADGEFVILVIAPLAAPGMVTTSILVFLACWNDFLMAISFTSTVSSRTAPAAMQYFSGGSVFTIPTGPIAAAAVVITIPIIIFVLFFQRRIVAGLTSGAVKG